VSKLEGQHFLNSEGSLRDVLESLPAGVMVIEPISHTIVDINRTATVLIGLPREKIIGSVCHRFVCPAEVGKCPVVDLGMVVDNAERVLLGPGVRPIPIIKTVASVELDGRKMLLESFTDISQVKQLEDKLTYMAMHDCLTGLPNRALFSDRLALAMTQAGRKKDNKLAVMMLDLDYFKTVNDMFGHAAGDDLLRMVAERLERMVRGYDTIARLGGDEFVALFPEVTDILGVADIAARIVALFRQPFKLEGHEVTVTASVGVALYPDHGKDIELLLKHADMAMYLVKGNGRCGCAVFGEGQIDTVESVERESK
jgi:diguanylate cyclase (GGDEF)-like protein